MVFSGNSPINSGRSARATDAALAGVAAGLEIDLAGGSGDRFTAVDRVGSTIP